MDMETDRLIRSYISALFAQEPEEMAEIIWQLAEMDHLEVIQEILSTTGALVAHLQEVFCGAGSPEEQLAVWNAVSMDIELSLALGEFDE